MIQARRLENIRTTEHSLPALEILPYSKILPLTVRSGITVYEQPKHLHPNSCFPDSESWEESKREDGEKGAGSSSRVIIECTHIV